MCYQIDIVIMPSIAWHYVSIPIQCIVLLYLPIHTHAQCPPLLSTILLNISCTTIVPLFIRRNIHTCKIPSTTQHCVNISSQYNCATLYTNACCTCVQRPPPPGTVLTFHHNTIVPLYTLMHVAHAYNALHHPALC